MVIYKIGDLFSSKAPALAQGCNTTGKMGAGIAKTFKNQYIGMYKEYKRLCGEGIFNAGEGYIYKTDDNRYIFNLATQGSLSGAAIEYVDSSFKWMKEQMLKLGINYVAIPKIGCGLGGLDWENDVLPIIENVFDQKDIVIEVWTIPS
jgi:O-acetyl-ADP-ribose deacetylase (regulator of RNase III)